MQSIKEFFYKINTQLQEDFEHFFITKQVFLTGLSSS